MFLNYFKIKFKVNLDVQKKLFNKLINLKMNATTTNNNYANDSENELISVLFFMLPIVLSMSTVCLNSLVIYIILFSLKKRSFSNYLFLSSAIADLLIGLLPEPLLIVYIKSRFQYQTLKIADTCVYKLIMNNSCMFLNISLFNLLIITVHRYRQLRSAKVNDKLNNTRYLMIICVWFISILFWTLMLIPIINRIQSSDLFYGCFYVFSLDYVLLIELITLITPIVFIVLFNMLTFNTLKLKSKRIKKPVAPTTPTNPRFKVYKNRPLSNSDNCLNLEDKQIETNLNSPVNKIGSVETFANLNRSFNLKYAKAESRIKQKNLLAQKARQGQHHQHHHFDYLRRKLTKERKAFLCLFVISIELISSWLLFLVIWPLRVLCLECINERFFQFSVWLNYSSAAANPLILLMFHSKYQHELMRLYYGMTKSIRQLTFQRA